MIPFKNIYISRWNLHIYLREINYIILCSLETIRFLYESFLFYFIFFHTIYEYFESIN